jgi:hypothetical protein
MTPPRLRLIRGNTKVIDRPQCYDVLAAADHLMARHSRKLVKRCH